MDFTVAIFQIVILIFSAVIHEISHGAMANHLGDPTAKLLGRLTLNPIKHLEPFGSVLLPFTTYLASGGSFLFGWAKPVPYNPMNIRDPRWGSAYIALAGPAANFAIALVFGLALRFVHFPETAFFAAMQGLFTIVVYVNILLGVFNLVPIPPLDGSKLLFAVLGDAHSGVEQFLEQNSMLILLLFLFFGFPLITPIITFLFTAITGFYF